MRRNGSIPALAGEPYRSRQSPLAGWVYPRVGGGTTVAKVSTHDVGGLSPRWRGNQPKLISKCSCGGSIPALAGEPVGGGASCTGARVYPRVGGGTGGVPNEPSGIVGLSPRWRGNRPTSDSANGGLGSIPALAGEPVAVTDNGAWQRVYPRVGGGTCSKPAAQLPSSGLSPRWRGNRVHEGTVLHLHRSIPALAGEPLSGLQPLCQVKVYPRVGGGTPRPSWR